LEFPTGNSSLLLGGYSMAEDWAVMAARKALEQDRVRQLNLENNSRQSTIKDHEGPAIFGKLEQWISNQATEFNKILGREELTVAVTAQKSLTVNQLDRVIRVNLPNRGPLTITYSVAMHSITWECGAGKGELRLTIGEGGSVNFETPYHQTKSVEEMGAEMLDKLQESPF
jgi:hypothetical protein